MTLRTPLSVHGTSVFAGLLGAVLSPIPLADEIMLLPIYGALSLRIGWAHGLNPFRVPWRPIAVTAINGLAARAVINLAVALTPGVAAVANAASAFALTEWYGHYLDRTCADPQNAQAVTVAEITRRLRRKRSPTNGVAA
jgi:uncharacterized protein (DUF697 family)